jgi:transposase
MLKNKRTHNGAKKRRPNMNSGITVGMDMGDKKHDICILDASGNVIKRSTLPNTAASIQKYFKKLDLCLVAMEVGTHSRWVSQIIDGIGHKVLVGNARKLRLIWDSNDKTDVRDAEMLARIARVDPKLLYPINHRGAEAQADLAVIKSRDILVKTRTALVSHARGLVKSCGQRINKCSTASFHNRLKDEMPEELRSALTPIMETIEQLTEQIKKYDYTIKDLCQKYPETEKLQAVAGVGPKTALGFVLTIEDYERFKKSRDVGPYLGLTPRRDQSGMCDKQLGITKAGDTYLRTLLVGCAQYILGVFGPDCDLRRAGLKIAERGGKNGKRRAVVAVARKLAVLLHTLWKSDEPYDPFYKDNKRMKNAA